jgi:glycosyltransferase involved in cell wall biosynthesis
MELSLKKNNINNTIVIYNTHEIEQYQKLSLKDSKLSLPEGKFLFLNIGRLSYAKGQWHLLKSFSLVAKNNPDVFLIILGEGLLRRELKDLCDRLGIQDKVFMPGNIDNVFPVIMKAGCFVFSSLYEGLPNVLIETLAVGTRIISTDCVSGPREIIAPELDVEADISYPYRNKHGSLVGPFKNNEKMDFTENITGEEISFAEEMIEFMKKYKSNNNEYLFDLDRFSIKSTISNWNKVAKEIVYG